MSSKVGSTFFKQMAKLVTDGTGCYKVMRTVKIVSSGNGRCLAEYKVDEDSMNSGKTMYGGLMASLVDTVTTLALVTTEPGPGVSVGLSINYLKAAKIGDIVEIDANTVKAGKSLAYLNCELRLKGSGEVIATGTHTKFIGNNKKSGE